MRHAVVSCRGVGRPSGLTSVEPFVLPWFVFHGGGSARLLTGSAKGHSVQSLTVFRNLALGLWFMSGSRSLVPREGLMFLLKTSLRCLFALWTRQSQSTTCILRLLTRGVSWVGESVCFAGPMSRQRTQRISEPTTNVVRQI